MVWLRGLLGLAVALSAGTAIADEAAESGVASSFTIVAVGDTGLNQTMQPVTPRGAIRHGRLVAWDEMLRGVRAEINGDLNFLNLETVVTARNDLRAAEAKAYRFRSHPDGVRQLVRLGFNVFSLANNHIMDFGAEGARDTLRHLDEMKADGLLAHAGLGLTYDEAAAPRIVTVRGNRIAIGAISFTSLGFPHHRAGAGRPGHLSYHSDEDFAEVIGRLKAAAADYRILSVHYGRELDVFPSAYERERLRRRAVQEGGIDLVIGHHSHVVSGIETVDGRVVLYGLGNFLHFGTQDMSKLGPCRDYGLLARLHIGRGAGGRLALRGFEAVPLSGTSKDVVRLEAGEARRRIAVINYLSGKLGDAKSGVHGLEFAELPDGRGVYCVPGAGADGGNLGNLCGSTPARSEPAAPAGLREIAASCSRNGGNGWQGRGRVAHRR